MSEQKSIFDRCLDDHDIAITKALGGEYPKVSFSAYECDADDNPINNLNEVAIEGRCMLMAKRDEFWGGKESEDYSSPVLENPTWLEVSVLANAAIKTTNDFHHRFLEDVVDTEVDNMDGIAVYIFAMGS